MSGINRLPGRKKTPPKAIIAVDFDGVIHDVSTHEPMPGALDALDILTNRGFRIIVYSVRASTGSGHQYIEDWLTHHAVRYYSLTGSKPQADLYVDDKAIYHTDWDNTLNHISQRLSLPINII